MRVGWWSKWKFAFFLTPQFCHVHQLSCSLLQLTTSSMCVCMKDALVGVTAGLAESNGSLPPGLLLASSMCVCMKDALVGVTAGLAESNGSLPPGSRLASSVCVCMKDALMGVTAGLAESNGSLPPGSRLASSVCMYEGRSSRGNCGPGRK